METSYCFRQNGVNFLRCLALQGGKNLMTARVSILLKSRASLTCFRASSFLVGLRTYQHPDIYVCIYIYIYIYTHTHTRVYQKTRIHEVQLTLIVILSRGFFVKRLSSGSSDKARSWRTQNIEMTATWKLWRQDG